MISAYLQIIISFLLVVASLLQNTVNGETYMDVTPSIKALLMEELAEAYPKPRTTRPVLNTNTTTMIASTFVLTQVIQLDDAKQILELSSWFTLMWQDEFISWDLAETGVECLQVPQDTIWIPDVVLLQNTDKIHAYFMPSVPVEVCYNGSVTLSTTAIFKTFCHIDIAKYPNDKQTCTLEFISWTHDINKLDFEDPIPTDIDQGNEFVENGIWKLPVNGVEGSRSVNNYSSRSHASLQFSITLQRRNEFQKKFYLVPYYFCSFLMSVMFLIPYETGRVSYGITVLLAQIVFSQLIVFSLPPVGDNVPEIGSYFVGVIGFSTVCLFFDVLMRQLLFMHQLELVRKLWNSRKFCVKGNNNTTKTNNETGSDTGKDNVNANSNSNSNPNPDPDPNPNAKDNDTGNDTVNANPDPNPNPDTNPNAKDKDIIIYMNDINNMKDNNKNIINNMEDKSDGWEVGLFAYNIICCVLTIVIVGSIHGAYKEKI